MKEKYINELAAVRTKEKEKRVSTETIFNLLLRTFPSFSYNIDHIRGHIDNGDSLKNNRISHPNKFQRYFSLSLRSGSITKATRDMLIFEADVDLLELYLESFKNKSIKFKDGLNPLFKRYFNILFCGAFEKFHKIVNSKSLYFNISPPFSAKIPEIFNISFFRLHFKIK